MIGGIHCRPALNEIAEEIELIPMANKIMQRATTARYYRRPERGRSL